MYGRSDESDVRTQTKIFDIDGILKLVLCERAFGARNSTISNIVKGGAYFCYCAYVLRISRYSDFLLVVPTNTGIFFARFKTMRRK